MTDHGLITDLAAPRLPLPIRGFNAALGPVRKRAFCLEPDVLMARASASTGLTDFGDRRFEEPLRVVGHAIEHEAELHALGRVQSMVQITNLLATRLRFVELFRRHPEIRQRPVDRPIVVVGMPRTGTTFLQRLIAADPGLRHLPLWESMAPLPKGDLEATPPEPDPRIRDADVALRVIRYCSPRMVAMHEMEARAPDEEIWLMAVDFATMLFEAQCYAPSFGEWYAGSDQGWAYASLRSMLQALDRYRPGERWILKSPQHLAQLGPLLSAFPDATVVQTHRDPVTVTASFANMVSYGSRNNTDRPDPPKLARYWERRIETMLQKSVADRSPGDPRFVDVHFHDLMADPIGAVRTIYRAAGRTLTGAAEAAMQAFLVANPRGKHGAHAYRLEDFGLEEAEIRRRFEFYTERFGVRPDRKDPS